MKNYLTIGIHLTRKRLIKLIILYFAVYTFYYILPMTAQAKYGIEVGSIVLVFFNFSAAFSLIFSCIFFRKIRKTRILYVWAILSVILILLLFLTTHLYDAYYVSSAIGFVFGIATWAFSTKFIEETVIEERGRIGGLVTSITLLVAPMLISMTRAFYGVYVFLSLLILLTPLMKIKDKHPDTNEKALILLFRTHWKEFLLYLLPWLILCINNTTFIQIVNDHLVNHFYEFGPYSFILQYLSAGLGALCFGVLMDWLGRKVIIIFGFTMLGLAGCLSGLIPNLPFFLFFNVVSGLAWSPLLVLFLLVVWGELAGNALSCVYLSLGLAVYHFTKGLGVLITPHLPIGAYEAALFNTSLTLLSVLLLVYAPNLLPHDVKERMHFKLYLAQVKKRLQHD